MGGISGIFMIVLTGHKMIHVEYSLSKSRSLFKKILSELLSVLRTS